jgi:hypothetical protein
MEFRGTDVPSGRRVVGGADRRDDFTQQHGARDDWVAREMAIRGWVPGGEMAGGCPAGRVSASRLSKVIPRTNRIRL